jgi:hypothetical protein
VRLVPALDVLARRMDNRDHLPGSGACASSVMVDNRCDAGREVRLVAGTRRAGALGRVLNTDIVCGTVVQRGWQWQLPAIEYRFGLLALQKQHLPYFTWQCLGKRRISAGHWLSYVGRQWPVLFVLVWLAICGWRVTIKLSCRFGLALEWTSHLVTRSERAIGYRLSGCCAMDLVQWRSLVHGPVCSTRRSHGRLPDSNLGNCIGSRDGEERDILKVVRRDFMFHSIHVARARARGVVGGLGSRVINPINDINIQRSPPFLTHLVLHVHIYTCSTFTHVHPCVRVQTCISG